jgi:hypothetical protein
MEADDIAIFEVEFSNGDKVVTEKFDDVLQLMVDIRIGGYVTVWKGGQPVITFDINKTNMYVKSAGETVF